MNDLLMSIDLNEPLPTDFNIEKSEHFIFERSCLDSRYPPETYGLISIDLLYKGIRIANLSMRLSLSTIIVNVNSLSVDRCFKEIIAANILIDAAIRLATKKSASAITLDSEDFNQSLLEIFKNNGFKYNSDRGVIAYEINPNVKRKEWYNRR